jgi:predicted O-methyltransferase YrrM
VTKTVIIGMVVLWLIGALVLALVADADLVAIITLAAIGLLLAGVLLDVRHAERLTRTLKAMSARHDQQIHLLQSIGAQLTEYGPIMAEVNQANSQQLGKLDSIVSKNDQLIALTSRLPDHATIHDAVLQGTLDTTRRVRTGMDLDLRRTFQQIEALQNLYAIHPTQRPLPATRGWAASPDLLLTLVDMTIRDKPRLVVECGSGVSTLWLALTMQQFDIAGRIVSLEHDGTYAALTREILRDHQADSLCDVREAPLESFQLDGDTYQWYAQGAWSDLTAIDLLFVDGPPGDIGRQARYPALPLLRNALSANATVVVDDFIRTDEQQIVSRWLKDYTDFSSQILPLEKQAAIMRRQPSSPPSR